MKKATLILLTFVSWISGTQAAEAASRALNVLYIISDDLNAHLGCYGYSAVKTPHLDRLASRGMRFDAAYCNYPVCGASRASFLSGRRPDTTRCVDNATPARAHLNAAVFLPECFRRQGYRTVKVGKIFHTGGRFEDPRSWDVDIREAGGKNDPAKKPPAEQILRLQGPDGVVLRVGDEETWDGFVARKAAELLQACAKTEQPFFVAAGFRRPHRPYIAPEKYYALYDGDKLAPRRGPLEHLANIPSLALTYRLDAAAIWRASPAFPEERPGDTIAAYYASISFMDAQVGVLLETLDRLKLWENTVVVFQSDHGYHLGEHGGLWHKMSLFEECARVPLIVAAPRVKPGVSPRLVELVDVYPTLAELCALKADDELEGTSFVPLLQQPNRDWKRAVFTVVNRDRNATSSGEFEPDKVGRTVFDGRWRYTEWPDASAELYDHVQDPFEYVNLARDKKLRLQLAEMKKKLHGGWRNAVPPNK